MKVLCGAKGSEMEEDLLPAFGTWDSVYTGLTLVIALPLHRES